MKALSLEGGDSRQQDMCAVQFLRSFPLLRTKLAIPYDIPLSLSRPRLVTELDKGRGFKLTLISAPTGFGKTTALSEWVRQSRSPVVWVSLGASDNDPTQFWAYVAITLASLSGHTATRVLELFPQDRQENILAEVMNIIAAVSQEFVLVLDNYHTIQNPEVHAGLTSLLEHIPSHMHIFLASRTRPPLPLPRLRAYRQLHELFPDDLLFNLDEISAFLVRNLGEAPLPERLQVIAEQTGGWVAILNLATTWLQKRRDAWENLADLSSNCPGIREYLLEEVLQRQPPAVQLFLLQTSILGEFNGALCETLTGRADSQLLLEEIRQANLFLTIPGEQQNWYRYRHLFGVFLREHLMQVLPDQVPLLHHCALAWFEKQEMYAEAVIHALAVQDFEKSAEILLNYGEHMLIRGEYRLLSGWLSELPEEFVRRYPLLCLFYAWSLMLVGQFEAAEIWINHTTSLADRRPVSPVLQKRPSLEMNEESISHVSMITSLLSTHMALFWDKSNRSTGLVLPEASALSEEKIFFQNLNRLNVGLACLLNGEIAVAQDAFSEVASSARGQGDDYSMLTADCGLVITYMLRGKLHEAFSLTQKALPILQHQQDVLSPFSVQLYIEISYLLYEWNRLDEAAHYAQEALAYGYRKNLDVQISGSALLSRVRLAQGELDEAYKLLLRAEKLFSSAECGLCFSPYTSTRLAEQEVDLALARKDVQRAEYWSQLPELSQPRQQSAVLPARVLLAKNQPREALKVLSGMEEEPEYIPLLLLQARIYQALGKMPLALQMLDSALRRAEPEGYIRTFLDAGPSIVQMLRYQLTCYEEQGGLSYEGMSRAALIPYVQALLAEYTRETGEIPPAMVVGALPADLSMPDELSERERGILRGITIGLSNQELASQMVIAESTVKWHIKNIYSKLNVHNRANAILKAQKLHLL